MWLLSSAPSQILARSSGSRPAGSVAVPFSLCLLASVPYMLKALLPQETDLISRVLAMTRTVLYVVLFIADH